MKKYILNKSNEMKEKILMRAVRLFETDRITIKWENGHWWIEVFIQKLKDGTDDIIQYDVVQDSTGGIDFEIRG